MNIEKAAYPVITIERYQIGFQNELIILKETGFNVQKEM